MDKKEAEKKPEVKQTKVVIVKSKAVSAVRFVANGIYAVYEFERGLTDGKKGTIV